MKENDFQVKFCWVDIPAFGRQYLPSGFHQNDRLLKRGIRIDRRELGPEIFSATELEHANQLYTAKRQIEWLAGRFAAKSVVAELLTPAEPVFSDIEIWPLADGSPQVKNFPDITISLSHSHQYAVCAATYERISSDLGVDVEKVRGAPSIEFLDVGFTLKEIAALSGRSATEIYRNWTIKEAYLKYKRRGFNENLHNVEVLKNCILDSGIPQDHLMIVSEPVFENYVFSTVLDATPGIC